ncbi:MAG: hypothetical protein BWY14_01201 [Parcubacteria group bacterium ADurb.Bin192]|nr:MAG: hypothetical protein BWY14_01201 [Parcubacteria group bacterium ADurb.Bin192]
MPIKPSRINFAPNLGVFVTAKLIDTENNKCDYCIIPKIEAELKSKGLLSADYSCSESYDCMCEDSSFTGPVLECDDFIFRLSTEYEINYYMGMLAGKAALQIGKAEIISKVKRIIKKASISDKNMAKKNKVSAAVTPRIL